MTNDPVSIDGAQIKEDGTLCRINATDESGERHSLTFTTDQIRPLLLMLVHCASQANDPKGSIPFFPARGIQIRKIVGGLYLLGVIVSEDLELTFGFDKDSLQASLDEIATFLERQLEATKPGPRRH